MNTPTLDEAALRWVGDYRGGTPIVLADGQQWHFPPLDDDDMLVAEAAAIVMKYTGPGGIVDMIFCLGHRLLCRNYALSDMQIRALFPLHPDDFRLYDEHGNGPSEAVRVAVDTILPDGRNRLVGIIESFARHINIPIPEA